MEVSFVTGPPNFVNFWRNHALEVTIRRGKLPHIPRLNIATKILKTTTRLKVYVLKMNGSVCMLPVRNLAVFTFDEEKLYSKEWGFSFVWDNVTTCRTPCLSKTLFLYLFMVGWVHQMLGWKLTDVLAHSPKWKTGVQPDRKSLGFSYPPQARSCLYSTRPVY